MTTTPIYAHGIGQLEHPCWTLEPVRPPDPLEDQFAGHWLTREAAEKALPHFVSDDLPATGLRVVQETFCCTTLILACGEEFVFQGDEDETHFVDQANLISALDVAGVVRTGGDLYADPGHCDECTELIRLHDTDTGEVAGQLGLDLKEQS